MGRRKRRSTGGDEASSGGAPKRAERSAKAGGSTGGSAAMRAIFAEFPNLSMPESEMLRIDCTLFFVLVATAVVQHLNVVGFTLQVVRVHPLLGLVTLSLLEEFIQRLFDHYARKMELFNVDGTARGESVLPAALQTSKLLGGVAQIVLIWRLFQEHPLHTVFGLAPLLHETVPQMAALVGMASEEGSAEGPDRSALSWKADDDFTTISLWWSTRFSELLSRAVVLSYMVAGLPLIFLTADASFDVWRCYTLVYVTFANVLLMSTLGLIVSHGGRLRVLAAEGGYWRSVHAGATGGSSSSSSSSKLVQVCFYLPLHFK